MDDYSDILLAVSPPYTDRDEPHTEYRSSRAVHYTAPSDTHTLYSDYAPDEEKGEQEEDSFDGLQVEKQQISSQHPAVLASPYSAYEGGFGAPPPTAQIRRNKTNRRVKLTQGNLILDCLIPTRLAGFLPRTEDEEFKYSRSVSTYFTGRNADHFILQLHRRHLRSLSSPLPASLHRLTIRYAITAGRFRSQPIRIASSNAKSRNGIDGRHHSVQRASVIPIAEHPADI